MAIQLPPQGMPIQEQLEMLRRCKNEIETMRATIDRLRPKAEAYEAMRQILDMMPSRRGEGMSEDLAWTLEKRRSELERELAPHVAAKTLGINEESTDG